ncbi:MAG: hypothetical protein ACRC6G_07660 [Deefgea sp.]
MFEENLLELTQSSLEFSCPDCCKEVFTFLELDCQAYANLHYINEGFSAFTLEVASVVSPLSDVLEKNGYTFCWPSLDELTYDDGVAFGGLSVWRKELWFDNQTSPENVLRLMNHLKQEMTWLAEYFPAGKQGTHYGKFMPR